MTTLDLSTVATGPAIFSDDRVYRYVLTRVWDEKLPTAAWIGLNPSTADEQRLDNTLRRVARFSHAWGYGAFVMLNIFAVRTKDPIVMKAHPRPVGPDNNVHLVTEASRAGIVIGCWGSHGSYRNRATEVRELLDGAGVKLHCLAQTAAGEPGHPLYLSSELTPREMT